MKAWLKTMMVGMVVLSGGVANAIDLRNEDEIGYRVTVKSTAMSRDLQARPLTLSLVVCVGVCEFEVEGVGTVHATKNDVVTIKGGKVTTVSRG